ncbi:MAG TPA: helix-turn-helix domain-containing protein [Acidimicrobiia bacterium]|nr:helix-turn-helix domain-containing protein [Acidimicrobiia bacterium]
MTATHGAAFPSSPAGRLPSGRHGLTREAVEASQRGRLLDAMAQVVAEKGYAATTVADVVERAGVSRRTFYEQFADKEACFLAAYDVGLEVVLGRIRDAIGSAAAAAGWRERARAGVEAFLVLLASEPAFARALQVEILTAGPAALERRAGMLVMFAGIWRNLHEAARAEDPALPPLPDDVFTVLTAGLEELVRDCVRTRGTAALPELAEPILRTVFAVFGAAPPA